MCKILPLELWSIFNRGSHYWFILFILIIIIIIFYITRKIFVTIIASIFLLFTRSNSFFNFLLISLINILTKGIFTIRSIFTIINKQPCLISAQTRYRIFIKLAYTYSYIINYCPKFNEKIKMNKAYCQILPYWYQAILRFNFN